jgi:hypothetical protein
VYDIEHLPYGRERLLFIKGYFTTEGTKKETQRTLSAELIKKLKNSVHFVGIRFGSLSALCGYIHTHATIANCKLKKLSLHHPG